MDHVVDLENGSGGGNNDADAVPLLLGCPDPADRRRQEGEPLTWRSAAPYIAATLVGGAVFTVSKVRRRFLRCSGGDNGDFKITTECVLTYLLGYIGLAVAYVSFAWIFNWDGCSRPRARRLEAADLDN